MSPKQTGKSGGVRHPSLKQSSPKPTAKAQILQLKRLYATLSQVNQTIVRVKEEGKLFQSICDLVVRFGEFSLAWVGLLDENTGAITPVAANGLDVNNWPLPIVNIRQEAFKDSLGTQAIHTGQVTVSEDIQVDPRLKVLRPFVAERPYRASAAVPFKRGGKVIGILGFVSPHPGFFKAQEELALLEEMGMDISFALDMMENERIKQQWADAFEHSSHGMVIGDARTNRILACNPAFAREQGGSIQEMVGMPLIDMYLPEDHERIKQLIARSDREGRVQFEALKVRKDGSTYPIQLDLVSVHDEKGELLYRVASQQDITERKRAEQALRMETERFRHFSNSNIIGVVIADANGKITLANDYYLNLLGVTRQDLDDGKVDWRKFTPPEWLPADEKAIAELNERGICEPYEKEYIRTDGTRVPVYLTDAMLPGEKKEIAAYVLDFTERKRAEEKNRESEERFFRIFQTSPIGIILTTIEDGRILDVNDAFLRIFGREREEVIGNTTLGLDFYADLGDRSRLMSMMRDQGRILGEEVGFRRSSGEIGMGYVSAEIIDLPGGKVLLSMIVDLTERKQAEEKLAYQAFLLEHVNDAILATDGQRIITSWNLGAEKMFGWTKEEALGHLAQEIIFTEITAEQRDRAMNQLAETGEYKAEVLVTRKDGSKIWVEGVNNPLHGRDGEILGYVSINREITERKQAEEKLRESEEKYRGLFEHMVEGFAYCEMIFENGQPQDWVYLEVNQAFEDMTGLKDAIGKRVTDIIPGIRESDPGLFEIYGRVAMTGQHEKFEIFVVAMQMWFSVSVYSPKKGFFVAVFDVITERKRAEEEQFRLMRVLEASLNEIYLFDENTLQFIYINQGALKNLGYSMEELRSMTPLDLKPEFSEAAFRDMIRPLALWEKDILVFDTIHRRKDGTTYPVEVHLQFVKTGESSLYVAIIHDTTEHKKMEKSLRESEARFRALVEQTPAITYMAALDEKSTTLYISPQINQYIDPSARGQAGSDIWIDFLHPLDRKRVQEELRRSREDNKPFTSEYRFITSDGKVVWFHDTANLVCDENEEPLFIQGLMFDITERKQIEEQVEALARFPAENPNPVMRCDLSGSLLYANPASAPLLGLWDCRIGGLLPLDWHERIVSVYASGSQDKLDVQCGNRVFSTRITPIEGKGYVNIYAIDVTERRQAEDDLKRYATRLEEAERHAQLGSWAFDVASGQGWWSNQMYRLFGLDISNTVPEFEPYLERIHPDDRQIVLDVLEEMTRGEEPDPREYRTNPEFGPMRYLSPTVYTERNTRGEAIRFIGTLLDITERKQAEASLTHRLAELELLYQSGLALSGELEPRQIAGRLIEALEGKMDWHHIAIRKYDLDRDRLEVLAFKQPSLEDESKRLAMEKRFNEAVTNSSQGLSGWVVRNGQVVRSGNVQADERYTETYPGIASGLYTPMLLGERVVGVISVESKELNAFTESDERLLKTISNQAAVAFENARLFQSLQRELTERKQAEANVQMQLRRITALNEIDRAINSILDMHLSLDVLLNKTLSQLNVDAASVLLLNEADQTLEFFAGRGFRSQTSRHPQLALGEGLAGQVALERKLLHFENITALPNQYKRIDSFKDDAFFEYYGVPLIAKGTLKGVLEIFNRTPLPSDQDWLHYLETLGGQAAIAIDNAQLFEGIRRSNQELIAAYDATIAGWSHAMDLRDKETEGHSQRVTDLTLRLAKRLGVSDQERAQMRRGALLHDIGKLGVPDHILLKPGKLTDEEWEIMRQHPTYAFEMLEPIRYLRPALDIPYCHHEKWDGTGYPRRLKGEQIPLAARIFAIVDVWDALRSDRPYRAGWSAQKTRDYILAESGKHFDPQVVEAFLQMLDGLPELS